MIMRLDYIYPMYKIICLFLAYTSCCYAQPDTLKIQSTILGEEVELWIDTPDGYGTSTTNYPLMVVLDADGLFTLAAEMNRYLSMPYALHMPAMIVAGVRSKTPAWRSKYFLPPDSISSSNNTIRFQEFLATEVFPQLNKKYRTNGYRLIVGHSLGGLFATYTLVTRADLFDAYIAISPTLHRHAKFWQRELSRLALTKQKLYYFSAAENDLNGYLAAAESMRHGLTSHPVDNLKWEYSFSNGQDHYSTAPVMMYEGFVAVFRDKSK